MGVLVVYSARVTATAAVARRLAEGLRENGADPVVVDVDGAADIAADLGRFRAVVVVGARRRGRWPRPLRRFLRAQRAELRRRPVWLVSAERPWPGADVAGGGVPVRHVCNLLAAVGAEGHARFDPREGSGDDARMASWSRDVASFLVLQAPVSVGGWAFDGKAHVDDLDRPASTALLRTKTEGRLAALDGARAVAPWVTYRLLGERIVLTPPADVNLLGNRVRPVSLEVAGRDDGRWNVVVSGWLEPLGHDAIELVVARVTGRRRTPQSGVQSVRKTHALYSGRGNYRPQVSIPAVAVRGEG